MMNLNIISDQQKREVKKRKILYILKNNLFLIIILSCLYTIIFLISYLVLEIKYADTLIEKSNIQKTDKDIGLEISDINTKVKTIADIQKNSPYWSNFIILLSNNINNGINISSIIINDDILRLTGSAVTRDDLIELQETLENLEILSEVNFPLKNILSSKNITFDISAKITSYDFK